MIASLGLVVNPLGRRMESTAKEKDECRLCLEEVLEGASADGGGRLQGSKFRA